MNLKRQFLSINGIIPRRSEKSAVLTHSRPALLILGSGLGDSETATEFRSGLTELDMKASGKTTELMAKESSCTLMGMCMKGTG
jgi:hypothetical protein